MDRKELEGSARAQRTLTSEAHLVPVCIFVNKVLLELYNMPIVYTFPFVLQRQSWDRTCDMQSLKYLLSGPAQKWFANTWLKQWGGNDIIYILMIA